MQPRTKDFAGVHSWCCAAGAGAGRAGRISVGTTVFGGMIAATTLNLVFIPVLYVVVRSLVPGREAVKEMSHAD